MKWNECKEQICDRREEKQNDLRNQQQLIHQQYPENQLMLQPILISPIIALVKYPFVELMPSTVLVHSLLDLPMVESTIKTKNYLNFNI